jgi:SAM-dependent methyltransferase
MKCNVCENVITKFVERKRPDGSISIECPICKSYRRHRALVAGFQQFWTKDEIRIFDIGPHASLVRYFKKIEDAKFGFNYFAADIRPNINGVHTLDIQKDDHSIAPVDVVICLHVLEHCLYDYKALETIRNSMKTTGTLILEVPLKQGKTDRGDGDRKFEVRKGENGRFAKEVVGIVLQEEERLKRYADRTHYRYYGEDDILSLLDECGLVGYFHRVAKEEEFGIEVSHRFIIATLKP